MIKHIIIESWIATKSIQSNKPTRWQRLLAWLKLKPIDKPLYWFEAIIEISYPHPLAVGDIILCRNLKQYRVICSRLQSSALRTELFKISSIEPMERSEPELGKTVILGSTCSETDPNTQPYGGMII